MQISAKVKEINADFTEFAELYEALNKEISKGKAMNVHKVQELFEKKSKVWNRRHRHMDELQVLINKLNEDWKLTFDRFF